MITYGYIHIHNCYQVSSTSSFHSKIKCSRDLPRGSVVKTPQFQRMGHRFNSWFNPKCHVEHQKIKHCETWYRLWKCDKHIQSEGIPAFIQQILMSRDWAGWMAPSLGRSGRWAGLGSAPTSPAVAASSRGAHCLLTLSLLLCSSLPPPHFYPSFSLYCLPPTVLLVLTLDMNDHWRGHLPEIGDCAVLASPRFWENPWRRAVRTGTVTPESVCGFSPGTGFQAPEQGRAQPETESSTTKRSEARLRLCWRESPVSCS